MKRSALIVTTGLLLASCIHASEPSEFASARAKLAECKALIAKAEAFQAAGNTDQAKWEYAVERTCSRDYGRLMDAGYRAQDVQERRSATAWRSLSVGLESAGDDIQSATDAHMSAAHRMQPPQMQTPASTVKFDPGYAQRPPAPVTCVGTVMVQGPPDQAGACARP